MQDRRRKMIAHTPPPECEECFHANTSESSRLVSFNRPFEKHYQENIQPGCQDGVAKEIPVSVDYRTKACNLKCLMCNPNVSSAMGAHFKKNSSLMQEYGLAKLTESRGSNQVSKIFNHLDTLFETKKVVSAYFAGGEPLLAPNHLATLAKFLNQKLFYQVLCYNTNLMQPEERTREWALLLSKFSQVDLYCSMDATNELGAYLRNGFDQKIFDRNLLLVQSLAPNADITLDITVTSMGLFNFVELAKYAIQKKT